VVIGSLIDVKAVEKIEAFIADAFKKGAKVVTNYISSPAAHLLRQ
jgi:acyl-CoA reductase-like NAD-dependent aldehyde dehydrogenase